MRLLAVLAVLAVLLVTVASACGGGGGGGRLSAAEFVDRAEGICRDVEDADVEEAQGPDDVDRFIDDSLDVVEDAAGDFHELEPPEEFEERWQEYLDLVDDGVEMLRDFRDQAQGESEDEISDLAQNFAADYGELEQRGHEIEGELGLQECID